MRAIVKGALIGGGVGALVATAQATRGENDPPEAVTAPALKGAAEGALAGGLIGAFFDWRRTRATPEPAGLAPAAVLAAAREAFEAARPVIESAAEQAFERAVEAVEAARPHVESAAELARERAAEAVEAARPHVESAAQQARERAAEAADRAGPVVSEFVEEARARMPDVIESTIKDGPIIVVTRPKA